MMRGGRWCVVLFVMLAGAVAIVPGAMSRSTDGRGYALVRKTLFGPSRTLWSNPDVVFLELSPNRLRVVYSFQSRALYVADVDGGHPALFASGPIDGAVPQSRLGSRLDGRRLADRADADLADRLASA